MAEGLNPVQAGKKLFLVGIGSTFKLHGIRCALITFGSLLLILSTVLILRQPGLPS
jgi:hypothetical protein